MWIRESLHLRPIRWTNFIFHPLLKGLLKPELDAVISTRPWHGQKRSSAQLRSNLADPGWQGGGAGTKGFSADLCKAFLQEFQLTAWVYNIRSQGGRHAADYLEKFRGKNQHSTNHKITVSIAVQVSQSQSLGKAQTEQLETAIRDRLGRRRGGFGSLLPSPSRLHCSPLCCFPKAAVVVYRHALHSSI